MAGDHEWQEILDAAHRQLQQQRLAQLREQRLQEDWARFRYARIRAALSANHQNSPNERRSAR